MQARTLALVGVIALVLVLVAVVAIVVLPANPFARPSAPPPQIVLTALQAGVRLSRHGEADRTLQSNDSVATRAGDQIQIPDPGRATLTLPGRISLELLRGTQVAVTDIRQQAGDRVSVALKETVGNILVGLEVQGGTQVALETDLATISASTDDTEFVACAAPGTLTCVVTLKGSVQLAAGGKVVTLGPGEASYVRPGAAPAARICADLAAVRTWTSQARERNLPPDLGAMVVSWPQHGCTPGAAFSTATSAELAGVSPTLANTASPPNGVVTATLSPEPAHGQNSGGWVRGRRSSPRR
jgi:hypothetical protein